MCAHDDPPVLSMMLCRCGRLQAGCRCPVRYPGSGLYIRSPFAFVGRPIGHGSPVTSKTQTTTSEGRHGTSKEEIESREPDSPTDLSKPSLMYVLRKTAREFSKDQCTDLAAALTYYAVLALFPAAIALLSLVGLVGQGPQTVRTLMGILEQIGAGAATQTLVKTLTSLANAPQAAG